MDDVLFAIVVHDINIIKSFEKIEKYKFLKKYVYLLVGNHDTDYSNEYIIQCDRLHDNIENNKYYLAFTGWYALAKNINLISEKFKKIFLLEYDVSIKKDEFNNIISIIEKNDYSIYGISEMDINSCLRPSIFSNLLISFLKENQFKEIITNNKLCIASNNLLVTRSFLIDLFNNKLTLDFLKFLKNDKMSGHNLERYISVYCFLNNIKYDFINNFYFVHESLDSHDTQNKHENYLNYINTIK